MALKSVGKSETGNLEKQVRIAMIEADITQGEIADYEGLTIGAINNRLKRLTHAKAQKFLDLIDDVAAKKNAQTLSRTAS